MQYAFITRPYVFRFKKERTMKEISAEVTFPTEKFENELNYIQ